MKKLLLFLLLISSLYADSKLYIGSALAYSNESFNSISAKSSSPLAKLKLGYGDRERYSIEFSLEYIKNSSKIFSSSSVATDGSKKDFNLDLLKSFKTDTFFLPYFKAGFGSGYMSIDRAIEKELYYGSFNLGTGILLPINESFDIELGYEYKYLSYQAIDTIVDKDIYKSNVNTAYLGFNLRF